MLGVKRRRSARSSASNKKAKKESQPKPEVIKKEESSDDCSDGEDTQFKVGSDGMSDYERMRLENIRRNQQMLEQLNLAQAKAELHQIIHPPKKKPVPGLKKPVRPKEVLPRRQSLRIRRLDPEGAALPEVPVVEQMYQPEHPRKPEGPLDIAPKNDVQEKDLLDLLKDLCNAGTKHTKVKKVKVELKTDVQGYEECMRRLQIKEDHVAKVVPERIFSITLHPSETKTLVYAGDKWGRLGLWNVGWDGGDSGVYLFEPHSRPINCLRFSPSNTNKLFSASYDGTVRCMDVEKSVFEEVYATDEEDDILLASLAFLSSDSSMVVGQGDGCVTVVDARSKDSTSSYHLHSKMVRSVDISPGNPNLLATASTDGGIGLWDLRNIKNHKSFIGMAQRSRTVNSAYFSPQGVDILTTEADNQISVFDGETLAQKMIYRHNNHTGRWLTKFRAQWDPKTENCFVIGSMKQPRQVDIYCTERKTAVLLNLIDENMSSITSLNAFHPTRNLLVGGNSSGKVFLWTER